jgi:putative transposase
MMRGQTCSVNGQKMLLAVRKKGGDSEAAWRCLLDDLVSRGLPAPNLVILDGAAGLERWLANTCRQARCSMH